MSFEALKKQSKLGSLTDKLIQQVEKMSSSSSTDERFWKPVMGKEGVGSAIIRFLPAPEGEDVPWVKLYSHGFQGPTGAWYLENSLTSLNNQKDPVTDYNRSLVMKHSADGKLEGCPKHIQDIVRKQKRKLSYYANIYVIKDPANPMNEGTVKLYKFGTKVFDKILGVMKPEFEDETPINPFDFWQGANFKLKIVKKDGYWNYDKSEFDRPSSLLDDDDALEAIWKKEYSLTAITAPDQFKTYEELETRMNQVLGLKGASREVMQQEESLQEFESDSTEKIMEELEQSYSRSKVVSKSNDDEEVENDETLQYFRSLIDD